jgi:hypothetical protein
MATPASVPNVVRPAMLPGDDVFDVEFGRESNKVR